MAKCLTKYCRKKTESKGTKFCKACRKRKSREADPVKYAWQNLKGSAKRRGKVFELTLEQFRTFCFVTDYLKGKGRTRKSFTVDRRENEKGYTIENIRILTLEDNARKGFKKLEYDWQTGVGYVVNYLGEKQTIENIF